jgi:hypothetical protein
LIYFSRGGRSHVVSTRFFSKACNISGAHHKQIFRPSWMRPRRHIDHSPGEGRQWRPYLQMRAISGSKIDVNL